MTHVLASSRRGLTLIEVLVVVSIIGLLIALLLPAVQDARRSADRLRCQNNQRQIGLGLHQYAGANGHLPAGQLVLSAHPVRYEVYRRSAFVAILPFMDEASLAQNFNFSTFDYDLANITVELARPGWLVCPSDPEAAPIRSGGPDSRLPLPDPPGGTYPLALSSYGVVLSSLNYYWGDGPEPLDDPLGQMNGSFVIGSGFDYAAIRDGLSQTMFADERAISYANRLQTVSHGRWTGARGFQTMLTTIMPPNTLFKEPLPPDNTTSFAATGFSSFHPGGVNMLFGDGSVRFLRDSIDSWPINPDTGSPGRSLCYDEGFHNLPPEGVWQALATRAGGEVISTESY